MLSINSNINSLVAQENLNGSGNALSQAITRLSSGKRINSAADDAAGLAISTTLQTQINGLNQGVQNANDGVSIVQTASSGLSQITQSLQTIRQLAVEASSGSLSSSDQAALQQEVAQQVAEVNRISSQTTYNGINLLNGSAGNLSFQVGANVGQTMSLNLSQSVSAASMGTGLPAQGATIGQLTGLSLTNAGVATTAANPAITTINILADGNGGFTFTNQNNQTLAAATVTSLFGANTTGAGTALALTASATGALGSITSAPAGASAATTSSLAAITANNAANSTTTPGAAGVSLGTITGVSFNNAGGYIAPGESGATITSINVTTNGAGGFNFTDQNGNAIAAATVTGAMGFTITAATAGAGAQISSAGNLGTATTNTSLQGVSAAPQITLANAANVPPQVANINVSTTAGANQAIESIDNALTTVNNIQATLGAAQNRFTGIATTQQAQSTDLSSAQSQITDANFAEETANLSKAQVLQQAGISVLAQANSLPQQVLKLLQ